MTICGEEKKVLLDEITTNNGKQLDHILGKEKAGVVKRNNFIHE